MDRPFGRFRYWTTLPVTSREEGSSTLHLHRETVMGYDLRPATDRQAAVVAEVVYWDAAGHYYLQTFSEDVPMQVIEELIAEAKDKIRCS